MEIRFAEGTELEQINKLRKQVNDLHVKGKSEIFKPGFSEELKIWHTVSQGGRKNEGIRDYSFAKGGVERYSYYDGIYDRRIL